MDGGVVQGEEEMPPPEKKSTESFKDMLFPESKIRLLECELNKKDKNKVTREDEKKNDEEALNSLLKYKSMMGLNLLEAVKTMVTHGVSRKPERTRKVKAVKSKWRDRSFDEMKEVLERAPLKEHDKAEPRRRPPPRTELEEEELGSEYQDSEVGDGVAVGEADDKDKQLNVLEATSRKEEVKAELEGLLVEDVERLKQEVDRSLSLCVAKALRQFRTAEEARQQVAVQKVYYDMMASLKKYKKGTKRGVKWHYWRSRLALWDMLEEWYKGDEERRLSEIGTHLRLNYNMKLTKFKEEVHQQLDEKLKSTRRRWERQMTALVASNRQKHTVYMQELRRKLFLAYCDLATSSEERVTSRLTRLHQDWLAREAADARVAVASIQVEVDSLAFEWPVADVDTTPVRPLPWQQLALHLHQRYLALAEQAVGSAAHHLLTFADVRKYKDSVVQKKKKTMSLEAGRVLESPKWTQMLGGSLNTLEERHTTATEVESGSRGTISMILSLVESLVTRAVPPSSVHQDITTNQISEEVVDGPESSTKTSEVLEESSPEQVPEGRLEMLTRTLNENPGLRRPMLKI